MDSDWIHTHMNDTTMYRGVRVMSGLISDHLASFEFQGNVSCTGTRSCYDEGKRASETLLFDYHRQHKVDIRVVRIFNTYGEILVIGSDSLVIAVRAF
jgi:nucleoside-diphosphate-sugar epimerase